MMGLSSKGYRRFSTKKTWVLGLVTQKRSKKTKPQTQTQTLKPHQKKAPSHNPNSKTKNLWVLKIFNLY